MSNVEEALVELIKSNGAGLVFDSPEREFVRFVHPSWDRTILVGASRWKPCPPGRMLRFEFRNWKDGIVWLCLVLGPPLPGHEQTWTKLYAAAKGVFATCDRNRKIGSYALLREELFVMPSAFDRDGLRSVMDARWQEFITHSLPEILRFVNGQSWLFAGPASS